MNNLQAFKILNKCSEWLYIPDIHLYIPANFRVPSYIYKHVNL